jgi:hypothetical protein
MYTDAGFILFVSKDDLVCASFAVLRYIQELPRFLHHFHTHMREAGVQT